MSLDEDLQSYLGEHLFSKEADLFSKVFGPFGLFEASEHFENSGSPSPLFLKGKNSA